jgi:hypothetical protein
MELNKADTIRLVKEMHRIENLDPKSKEAIARRKFFKDCEKAAKNIVWFREKRKGWEMRKGQKLCNYLLLKGWINETVHQPLFYMDDKEFDEVLECSDKEVIALGKRRFKGKR